MSGEQQALPFDTNTRPPEWPRVRLLDVVSLANGQVDPKIEPYRDWPLIAPDHLEQGTGRLMRLETAAEQGAISGKYEVSPGDVVYSKIRPYLRKVWLADCRGLCSADMYPIRAGERVHAGFLHATLLGRDFSTFAAAISERTGIPKINRQELGEYHLRLPPLPEQRAIAHVLSSLDALIEDTEDAIAKLEAVRAGMLHDLLTRGVDENGEIRPTPTEQPGRYRRTALGPAPVGWECTTVGNVATLVTSGSRGWADYYAETGALFVRIGNLTRAHPNLRWGDVVRVRLPPGSEGRRTRLQEGDILISITADLGIVGVWPGGLGEAYINQHIALVRIEDTRVNPRFVGHLLSSERFQERIRQRNESGAKAGLNLPTVRAFPILIPRRAEADRISELIDTADARLVELEQALTKAKTLRNGLSEDLLRGRVRLPPAQSGLGA